MKTSPFGGETRTVPLRLLHTNHYHILSNIHPVHLSLIYRLQQRKLCLGSPYTSFDLDREQLDLILVAVRERSNVPVQDTVAVILLNPDCIPICSLSDLTGSCLSLPILDRALSALQLPSSVFQGPLS